MAQLQTELENFADHLGLQFKLVDAQLSQGIGDDVSTSILTITDPAPNAVRLDASGSLWNGAAIGGTNGTHRYHISVTKNVLDLLSPGTSVALQAGANAILNAEGRFEKSNAGNAWNSWIESAAAVGDGATEDFAVSWLVEEVTGTIREMGGLDDNPGQNASYTSGEFMLYQVNGNTLYAYENAANRGPTSLQLVAGDRLGVKVESGVVTYLHLRADVVTEIYKSTAIANYQLFFKGAFNRGDGSSGHSEMGDVQRHDTYKQKAEQYVLTGSATESISDDDIAGLENLGLIVQPGSTYSNILVNKIINGQFPAGTTYSVNHAYSGTYGQSSTTFDS